MNLEKYQILNYRFYAIFIDALILLVPDFFIDYFILTPNTSLTIIFSSILIFYFGTNFYSIYLHTLYGQTLGKMMVKIKVFDISENDINLKQAILRESPYILISLISLSLDAYQLLNFGITENFRDTFFDNVILIIFLIWLVSELIVALSNNKRRSIHDYVAGTIVVRI